jgi:hypothetical protein
MQKKSLKETTTLVSNVIKEERSYKLTTSRLGQNIKTCVLILIIAALFV